jgi:hypothetical protein
MSLLERFLASERPDLLGELDPHRELASSLDPIGQAVLGGWCELALAVREGFLDSEAPLLASYREQSSGYAPDDPDPERFVVPIFFGAIVNGIAEDLVEKTVRLDDLSSSFATLHEAMTRGGGSLYGTAVFAQVVPDAIELAGSPELAAPAASSIVPWQRLAWLSECKLRGGAVLARDRGEPLVGEPEEQIAYLLRLAANQPGLSNWPELARFVPRRSESLLPLSDVAYRRFRRQGLPSDPDLSNRLVEEIVEARHYALDTISVVELEELGVRRIVLTPEEKPEPSVIGAEGSFHCAFLVDHDAGTFTGTASLGDEATAEGFGRRAVVMIPAITQHAAGEPQARSEDREWGLDAFHEAQAAIELLILSTWRDLVVPSVREEHYEIDRLRKAKGSGKRAAKRGNLEIVRYIPRRLVYRRAAKEAAVNEGRQEPKTLHAVSAFSRRLPEGKKRSPEAERFAVEIGIPLAAHQTIVKPHFRGGTEDERKAAMESGFGRQVRRWRSWSALDLLRTLAAEPPPGEDGPA